MKSPILFLDIDGVLNSDDYVRYHVASDKNLDPDIDSRIAQPLGDVLRKTKARIVIISSWRLDRPFEETRKRLANAGLDMPISFLPGTEGATDGVHPTRAELIRQYLRLHRPSLRPYVIVDDVPMDDKKLLKHQIKTNPATGLTKEQIRLLNNKLNSIWNNSTK